jgi:SAM-dependent methyltransferase
MTSAEIEDYYDVTRNREPRADLIEAVRLTKNKGVAIDCGCGAGSDIAYLREQGFSVHGFDIEQASIDRCQTRFASDRAVSVTQASFLSFEYPGADLIVADASLFFCPPADFDDVWKKICVALKSGSVFVGAFLGPRDTMATDDYDREAYWQDVSTFSELELLARFEGFELKKFFELERDGQTAQGEDHHWHLFQVIAIKS